MVTYYGLSKKIGNVSYYDSTGQQEYAFSKPFSEKTSEIIDNEISDMIELAYQNALKLLNEHKDGLTQLAEKLLEKEVIFGEDLEAIFGKRPWIKEERISPKKLVIPAITEETAVIAENSKEESEVKATDNTEITEVKPSKKDKPKKDKIS